MYNYEQFKVGIKVVKRDWNIKVKSIWPDDVNCYNFHATY